MRIFHLLGLLIALAGGVFATQSIAQADGESCCKPGAECCKPNAGCCKK